MASAARLPYQRLANEGFSLYHDDILESYCSITGWSRTWWKFRRIPLRRRFRVRVPELRRFLRRRARFVAACRKVLKKRLKETQLHFGDLFAGNYLFMQVNPTPLKAFLQKPYAIHQAVPGMPSAISAP